MSLDQSNILLRKEGDAGAQSAQSKLQGEATEHTLAGSVIGAVRDVIPGIKGTAESNDMIAHVAADTIASMPFVKTAVGGVVRATFLIDPTKGAEANASAFGLNFVEGAAMNKVSKLAMPESGFSTFMQNKLGTGLASEAATHLSVGFGFGAIRTGFDGNSWKDSNGKFDLTTGAENLIKGSATGALINLPAGMLGFRVARASSVALENSIITPRLASVISGAGAGYAAGGVYGGVDAVMHGKGFTDVLKQVNEGGLIGAASGGAMGAFDGTPLLHSRQTKAPLETNANVVEPNIATKTSSEATSLRTAAENIPVQTESSMITEPMRLTDRVGYSTDKIRPKFAVNDDILTVSEKQYEAMSIKPLEAPRVEDVQNRLTSQSVEERTKYVFKDGEQGPWVDFEDFAARALVAKKIDFRVYKVDDGKFEITVPETYAKQLDEVRALRIKAEKPSILDDLPKGQDLAVQTMVKENNTGVFRSFFDANQTTEVLPIIWARIHLAKHPLGQRVLPEDIISLADEMPGTSKIKRVYLWDEGSPQDPWLGQSLGEKDFHAAASAAESTGEINLFKSNRSDSPQSSIRDILRRNLVHERGHLYTPSDELYVNASLLERDGHYVSSYSRKNDSERWSEDNARGFLATDVDDFLTFAQKAPLRAAVMAQEFKAQMKAAGQTEESLYSNQFAERIKYVDDSVLPFARLKLAEHLQAPKSETQLAALRLMEKFATKNDLEPIMDLAANGASRQNRRRAFELAMKLQGDTESQFKFAWEQGQPGMPARDVAADGLRRLGMVDPRAASYSNLLYYINRNDLPGLAKQVTSMYGDEGAEIAYNFAMHMGRDVRGYQRAVALSALEDVPSLRVRALHTLTSQEPEFIAPAVKKYVNDNDPEVAGLAKDVLNGIELRGSISKIQIALERGGNIEPKLIQELGDSGKTTAVGPLVEVVAKGPEASRKLAIEALTKFEPGIVKFMVRKVKVGLSQAQSQNLKPLTDYNFTRRHYQDGLRENLGDTNLFF